MDGDNRYMINTHTSNMIRTDVLRIIGSDKYDGIQFSSKFTKETTNTFNKLFKDSTIDKNKLKAFTLTSSSSTKKSANESTKKSSDNSNEKVANDYTKKSSNTPQDKSFKSSADNESSHVKNDIYDDVLTMSTNDILNNNQNEQKYKARINREIDSSILDGLFDDTDDTPVNAKYNGPKQTIHMTNMVLPKCMSLHNFKHMLAFVLDLEVSSIALITDTIPRFRDLQISDYIENFTVGNADISIRVMNNQTVPDMGYDKVFYGQYINAIYYFSSFHEWTAPAYPSIESISIMCVKKGVKINAIKLFNINSLCQEIKKILIHSHKLDNYMSNYRKMQYVKCQSYLENGFTNTVSNYNTVTFYVNLWEEEMEVYVYERSRLQTSNTFPCRETSDQVYYALYLWKLQGLDQERDELHLAGGTSEKREALLAQLKRYIRQVFVLTPADNLDLQTITLCE